MSLTFLFLIFLIFLKSDFRIINELRCCQDDYDYYSHALTIVDDFDFDYSNQINTENRFYANGKTAPIGFFGSGFLASPFLFLGKLLDNLFNTNQDILEFRKLIYSFSSIFYLFASLYLLNLTFEIKWKKYTLPLAFFGSGIIYYAFERYSMTHVYEVFTISLIFYFSKKYYLSENNPNIYSILLPLGFLLAFLVRWTNYYIILLPLIFIRLSKYNSRLKITKDIVFFLTSIVSIWLFSLHTIAIYGKLVFSPTYVYGAQNVGNSLVRDIQNNFFSLILDLLKDIFNVLFTQEFGIFWFAPIIFLGFVLSIYNFLYKPITEKLSYALILICYAQCFFIISIWNTAASSYGFRYLLSLVPLSLFVLSVNLSNDNLLLTNYLKLFSIFGILSVLFFETTLNTQLSLIPIKNSFGIDIIYSQPNYLSGVVMSFFELQSYMKIIATSFFGAIIFKFLIFLVGKNQFFSLLENFGELSTNEDLISLIEKLEIITWDKFIVTILFSLLILRMFNKSLR
tara:strand:+ start:183 stop:1718 length:1536 start_codon:yes stop_codon:yes gene_type:complete